MKLTNWSKINRYSYRRGSSKKISPLFKTKGRSYRRTSKPKKDNINYAYINDCYLDSRYGDNKW